MQMHYSDTGTRYTRRKGTTDNEHEVPVPYLVVSATVVPIEFDDIKKLLESKAFLRFVFTNSGGKELAVHNFFAW